MFLLGGYATIKLNFSAPLAEKAHVGKRKAKENDMAGLFKDRFNYESLYKLALEIQTVYAGFQVEAFLHSTLDNIWDSLEFKQQVTRISTNLGKYLPADYKTALHIINKVILNYDVWMGSSSSFRGL